MRKLFIVAMLVSAISVCTGQSPTAKPIEPTAIGVVYLLDPISQELKALPNEQWEEGRGSQDPRQIFILVQGAQSSFRIKAAEKTEFVFNTSNPEKVSLYRFDQKKKKRQFLSVKLKITGGGELIRGVPIEVSKFGESSYRLVPSSPLTPGEYAINLADNVYTFGID
jgi:hypothetical protein